MMTKREGQEEQVEGSNKTESVPSSSGPASTKMYSNVISHYITESWHAAAPLHVVTWTHTNTHTPARLRWWNTKNRSSLSSHIRPNRADKKAFKSRFTRE